MRNYLEGGSVIPAVRGLQRVIDKHVLRKEGLIHAYIHVVRWAENPRLTDVLKNSRVAVGSIAAAGHMPDGFRKAEMDAADYHEDGFLSEYAINVQLRKARDGRLAAEGKPSPKAIRFVDTNAHNDAQKEAIYTSLVDKYNKAKQDADKVLFSVCSISAGFDINYIDSVIRLMKEKNDGGVVLSLFTPFNLDSV